jgi:hypothetical protein
MSSIFRRFKDAFKQATPQNVSTPSTPGPYGERQPDPRKGGTFEASTKPDHYWGAVVPPTPTTADSRSHKGGYTSAMDSKAMPYGEHRSTRENTPVASSGIKPSDAGSVAPGTQSASDGRVRQ